MIATANIHFGKAVASTARLNSLAAERLALIAVRMNFHLHYLGLRSFSSN
jgi:hypothetical protein